MISVAARTLMLVLLGHGHRTLAMTPTAPGPDDVFTAGQVCTTKWSTDGVVWDTFNIDLMSGSNSNMSLVTGVASGVDAADVNASSYNWTCPEVEPYSKIYFYQFASASNSSDKQWTTRFTIQSPDGKSEPPEQVSQTYGQYGTVAWGTGHLANSSVHEASTDTDNASSVTAEPSSSAAASTSSTASSSAGTESESKKMRHEHHRTSTESTASATPTVSPFAIAPQETVAACAACNTDPSKQNARFDSAALAREVSAKREVGALSVLLLAFAL